MPGKKLLKDRQHFTLVDPKLPRSRQRWYCHLCIPGEPNAQDYMTLAQAAAHETSSPQHQRNLQPPPPSPKSAEQWDWSTPTPNPADLATQWGRDPPTQARSLAELKEQSYHGYETCATYLIPFWRDAIVAAERGEELKLEEFIERRRKDADAAGWGSWGGGGEGWGCGGGGEGWGCGGGTGGWGQQVDKPASSTGKNFSRSRVSYLGWGEVEKDKGLQWGDVVDEQESFLESMVCKYQAGPEKKQRMYNFYHMPTPEKVQTIQDMIRSLHATPDPHR